MAEQQKENVLQITFDTGMGAAGNAIKDAMVNLSEKEKYVLDSKFFKNKKTKDLASELGVSSSRISKIVQSALDKIKTQLIKKGII